MRMTPGIAAIIILLFTPITYSATTQISNPLTGVTQQNKVPLARHSSAEEGRMIREQKLSTYNTVKVTTLNQKKFDSDHDGYLTGRDLLRYIDRKSVV